MSGRERAGEEETLRAWMALDIALQRLECALPSQMTAAMAEVVRERERFNDLMLGRKG